jgi:hypothetical protein
MTRAPCPFKQTNVTRAIKAVMAAGLTVVGVKISLQGEIEVVTAERPVQDLTSLSPEDILDRELTEFEAHHGKG